MPEIVYYVACSLDGYIATEDGGVDWLGPYQESGEDYGFSDFYSGVDGLLMGSHTYEFALSQGSWQAPEVPSWVFTHRKLPVAHPSVTLTADEPAKVVERLEAEGSKRLWLMGGGKLAASFRTAGLITRYTIFIIPIVLGGGIPLFAEAAGRDELRLLEAKPFSSGAVMLTYEPDVGEASDN